MLTKLSEVYFSNQDISNEVRIKKLGEELKAYKEQYLQLFEYGFENNYWLDEIHVCEMEINLLMQKQLS